MTAPDQPPPTPDDDPLVQMNVRVPRSLRDAIDARRATRSMSRDRWVANAARFALRSTAEPAPRTGPGTRTAPPPRRRP